MFIEQCGLGRQKCAKRFGMHAFGQYCRNACAQWLAYFYYIFLFKHFLVAKKFTSNASVVSQDEQAFRFLIEPADREEPSSFFGSDDTLTSGWSLDRKSVR